MRNYRHKPYQGAASLFLTKDRPLSPNSPEYAIWCKLVEPNPSVQYTPGFDTGDALAAHNLDALAESLEQQLDALAK